MSTKLRVKVVLEKDIRIWRCNKSESKLSSLKVFISKSFNITDFSLQYEDDENDRITISTEDDVEDGLALALKENRKSLKIYVISRSDNAAQQGLVFIVFIFLYLLSARMYCNKQIELMYLKKRLLI